VKTTKPTGNGVCPPHVERAHEIDSLINERAGTRDLADSDFDGNGDAIVISSDDSDDGSDGGDDEGDDDDPPKKKHVARISRPENAPTPRNQRGTGIALVEKLTRAFDPSAQRARDDARASRSLQNTQFLLLSQQVRDGQSTIETLRAQVTDLQTQVHTAEMARERTEMKLEMMKFSMGTAQANSRSSTSQKPKEKKEKKEKKKRRCDEWYPDGRSIYFVSDDSTDGDAEKENLSPVIQGHTRSYAIRGRPREPTPFHSPTRWGQSLRRSFTPEGFNNSPIRKPLRDIVNTTRNTFSTPLMDPVHAGPSTQETSLSACSTKVAPRTSTEGLSV
jgi:regulator of replication initiation timing